MEDGYVEFHESTCNGFGDIWWTDNPIYFSSIDINNIILYFVITLTIIFIFK